MTKQQPSLDRIFIVDATQNANGQYEKANEMERTLRRRVPEGGVEFIPMSRGQEEIARAQFERRLRESLSGGEKVMCFFDCYSAVKGGVIEVLRRIEGEEGKRTRKTLVSCHHGGKINKGFKKRGVSREGIRHVRYDPEGKYLDAIDALFGD